jgi:sigma-B regulation protein RsbU (phosphoserine phosphatase)
MIAPRQILLLSDNAQSVASLEGALGRGRFRLHRLARLDQLEQRLPALLTTLDGAIVDGTAPHYSNGRLETTLSLLDRSQLGSILLTPPGRNAADELQEMPLVWPIPLDRLDLLAGALSMMAGYQQALRSLQREIRLFQRLDHRITGQFNEIDEEMRLASRIQRDFLPKRLPAVGQAQFATLYRPASWVSGDLYDVLRLDERHVGFYIADAVGHGMPAALLTMFIKRSMETKHIAEGGFRLLGPEETMRSLNRALLEAGLSANQFTTAIYAVLDVQTLVVEFARGGHPHPIWLHGDGTVSEPEADGGLLGIFPDAEFARGSFQMAPGDKLILYSDGLETVFVDGEEPTSQAYREHLKSAGHLPVERMLTSLVDEMDRQIGSLNPRDDVTVVALEITQPAQARPGR